MANKLFAIIILSIFSFSEGKKEKAHRLERYNVDPNLVTVSGFSSGGAQAMQFHIAHSSKLIGAGIFSGVPYMYGHDRMREDFFVTDPENYNVSTAIDYAKKYEVEGLIDPLGKLKDSKVFVYHGTKDSTVYHGCAKSISNIYSSFSPTVNAKLESLPAEHGMPSDNSGGSCATVNLHQYLVNNCKYSGVYEMFNHLYGGELMKPNGTVGSVPLTGKLVLFDQTEFLSKIGSGWLSKGDSMDSQGYIYVPSGCSGDKKCKLAIALHGCAQTRQTYGDKFPRTTGYLEVAELNDIIILFPQTKRSLYNPRNPSGCWDWMGFTGKDFANKNGMQIKAIKNMLDRVLGDD